MSAIVKVQRPAFIQYVNGDIEIIQVNLQVDPAEDDPRYSGVPRWPVHFNYGHKRFMFKRDITSPRDVNRNRPLYVEKDKEFDVELTDKEKYEQLEIHAKAQHSNQIAMASELKELREVNGKCIAIIGSLESKIKELEK